jgi:hypothetical protein
LRFAALTTSYADCGQSVVQSNLTGVSSADMAAWFDSHTPATTLGERSTPKRRGRTLEETKRKERKWLRKTSST